MIAEYLQDLPELTAKKDVLFIIGAAAAAKSPQRCPTLCDPIDSSPPGNSVHGTFQARVLEWGAIAFSVIIGDWNAKVESQVISGIAGKFGLGVQK